MCDFMTLLLFVGHLYAIKLKWILIQRKLNSDIFGMTVAIRTMVVPIRILTRTTVVLIRILIRTTAIISALS